MEEGWGQGEIMIRGWQIKLDSELRGEEFTESSFKTRHDEDVRRRILPRWMSRVRPPFPAPYKSEGNRGESIYG